MGAKQIAKLKNLQPGTKDYDDFVTNYERELQSIKRHSRLQSPVSSPSSPLSPLSPSSPSSCIGRLNGLNSKPELNGSLAIIKDILPDGRINVIPITTSSAISVLPEKITNIPIYNIQLGGRKRKSRKNRYTKNSRRTKHSRRTKQSRRTKRTKRNR